MLIIIRHLDATGKYVDVDFAVSPANVSQGIDTNPLS